MQKIIAFFIISIISFSCSVSRQHKTDNKIDKITFLDEYIIPFNLEYKNTTVGGLSGIDYNKKKNEYYMICDDRSEIDPARFYTAHILLDNNKIDTVIFTDVTFLRDKMGNLYPNKLLRPDPEALRFDASSSTFIWTSEGERNVKAGAFLNPEIIRINEKGIAIDTFDLPKGFKMKADNGPRQNGVFEGLAFSGDFEKVFVSTEEPLYQDGQAAGIKDSTGIVRILEYNKKGENIAQYAYEIEPVAYPPFPPGSFRVNGISDIMWINEHEFLVIERSYSTGRLSCTIKVFLANTRTATDVKNVTSLKDADFKAMDKKLLLNMDDLNRFIDNIEGVTFGPVLKNGKASLLFIADNNFKAFQKSQIFLFEIN